MSAKRHEDAIGGKAANGRKTPQSGPLAFRTINGNVLTVWATLSCRRDPRVSNNAQISVSPKKVIESLLKKAVVVKGSPVAARQSVQWQIASSFGGWREEKLNLAFAVTIVSHTVLHSPLGSLTDMLL